jgi:hypothetical protein
VSPDETQSPAAEPTSAPRAPRIELFATIALLAFVLDVVSKAVLVA